MIENKYNDVYLILNKINFYFRLAHWYKTNYVNWSLVCLFCTSF